MIFFTYEMVEHAWNSVQEPVIIDTTISDPSGGDQPFFGNYLQGAGEGIIDTKEQVVLTRMGIMLWKVVTFYHRSIPEIEMELIHSKEHLNFQMLEYLSEEPENEFMETVDKIINTYTQSDLFRFFIDKIIEESERSNQPRTEMIGMIVVYLKTFIDCIDSVL